MGYNEDEEIKSQEKKQFDPYSDIETAYQDETGIDSDGYGQEEEGDYEQSSEE